LFIFLFFFYCVFFFFFFFFFFFDTASYEADPNAAGGRDRSTPMHLCAYHGYVKCATALVKAGANLEAKNEYVHSFHFIIIVIISFYFL
jgi:hypothetical protein